MSKKGNIYVLFWKVLCSRHGTTAWVTGWLPVGLENLDSYLNVENLKLRKLQVSDSKPERLLQIKVNLEMVFVYRPRAYIANLTCTCNTRNFTSCSRHPQKGPGRACVVTTLECANFHILIIVITRKNVSVVNRCWYHMTMLNGWGCHKRSSDDEKKFGIAI